MAKRDIISTRLRMPVGLHRLIVASAKANNRSLNSEVLWCMAQQLGGDAHKFVEQMAVEQRRRMHRLAEIVYKDPERVEKALAEMEKREVGK
jgi:predicted transcriptional regulator